MSHISEAQVTTALTVLAETAANRQAELDAYTSDPDHNNSDVETDYRSPLFDSLYDSGGSDKILKRSNFNARDFNTVWRDMDPFLSSNYNVGRGKIILQSKRHVVHAHDFAKAQRRMGHTC